MHLFILSALIGALWGVASCNKVEELMLEALVDHAWNEAYFKQGEEMHTKRQTPVSNTFNTESLAKLHNFQRSSRMSKEMENDALVSIAATKELTALTQLPLEILQSLDTIKKRWQMNAKKVRSYSNSSSCLTSVTCDSNDNYRSHDGSCNNLQNPDWGRALMPQARLITKASYQNGIDSPRSTSIQGSELPSARLVSNKLFRSTNEVSDRDSSLMVMAWGQFLDHDLSLTPRATNTDGSRITCCPSSENPECFPIQIPTDDPYFSISCMEFSRSAAAASSCAPGQREQLNGITSYIDASMVYGSDSATANSLRSFIGGKLAVSTGDLLPPRENNTCVLSSTNNFCMKAGDKRVNVIPSLGANHVLFVREHNRIASTLESLNPRWSDEKLYQETRRIIGALIQHITYTEWLPSILSSGEMDKYGLNRGGTVYSPHERPDIMNEFSTAALRFGHSMITPFQAYLLSDYRTYDKQTTIDKLFLDPNMVEASGGSKLPFLVRWMVSKHSMKRDRFLEAEIRDKLFLDSAGNSFDLGALNVQRGRDHGLPPYMAVRKACGLSSVTFFDELPDHTNKIRRILQGLYRSVDDIDLYAGGLSEESISGSIVGPTFSCLLGKQFQKLMIGDRFWYRTQGTTQSFTHDQSNEIAKVSFSKILCDNFGLKEIPDNVFKQLKRNGVRLEACSNFPAMNFSPWKQK